MVSLKQLFGGSGGGGIANPNVSANKTTTSGTGVKPGSTVTIYKNGTQAGTATANGSGAWSYTFGSALAAGDVVTYDAVLTSQAYTVPSAAPVAPTLSALSLSPSTATVGAAYSGTVAGKMAGSTLSLTGAGAAGLTVSGSTVTGTPATTGTVNLIETLAGATNTPNTTSNALNVGNAAVTLAALTLSSAAATAGSAFSATISGKTSGSTISATSSDGTTLAVSGTTLSGTFSGAGTPTVTLTESLAGATNSPRTSTASVTVSAAATVPAAPTITVSAGNGQVSIAWTDGANGGAAITSHKLYRGTVSGARTLVGTIGTASPYTDTGLTNGTRYYYSLSAVNSAGEGTQSGELSAVPVAAALLSPTSRPAGMVYSNTTSNLADAPVRGFLKSSTLTNPYDNANDVFKADGAVMNIVAHGDSLTMGTGANMPYLPRLIRMIFDQQSKGANYKKRGIPGQGYNYIYDTTKPNLINDAAAQVDTALDGSLQNWLIIFAGTNDVQLGTRTAAQVLADFDTYYNARISAGWVASRIVVPTILPRQNNANASTVSTINSGLASRATSSGFKIVRGDQNANIGGTNNTNLTYYNADQIHLTDAGQAVLTSLIYGAMFP